MHFSSLTLILGGSYLSTNLRQTYFNIGLAQIGAHLEVAKDKPERGKVGLGRA